MRLAFVGDINLGTLTLPDGVPPDSGRGLLDGARPALTGDLVVGNFEGVLGDSGTTYKCGTEGVRVGGSGPDTVAARKPDAAAGKKTKPAASPLAATPSSLRPPLAPRLLEAGFTHLNLANNHANDFGPRGSRIHRGASSTASAFATTARSGSIAIDSVRRGDSVTDRGAGRVHDLPYAYDLLDIARSAAVVDSVRPAGGSPDRHLPRRRRRVRARCTWRRRRSRSAASRAATCAAGPGP